MTFEQPVPLRWWHFNQNNSGGYYLTNETVAEHVFIQAASAAEAETRAGLIFAGHSEWCDCCGERWLYWDLDEEDGTPTPEMYGVRLESAEPTYGDGECRLHYIDGHVEKYVIGQDAPLPLR